MKISVVSLDEVTVKPKIVNNSILLFCLGLYGGRDPINHQTMDFKLGLAFGPTLTVTLPGVFSLDQSGPGPSPAVPTVGLNYHIHVASVRQSPTHRYLLSSPEHLTCMFS